MTTLYDGDDAADHRHGPTIPPVDPAVLREQVPGNPDFPPPPDGAHIEAPYDH
jgi:hypothetical protein